MRNNRIRSKLEGHQRRKQSWGCLKCCKTYSVKKKQCDCGSNIHYFPSKAELRHFRNLQLEQLAGEISELKLQPSFKIVLNGKQICTYRADFEYIRDGHRVVEDVKPTLDEKYLDPLFKLKKKIVEAIYGITIQIVK